LALIQLVEHQRVALVGNAQSQLQRQQGPDIDSHDVIIRMNRAAGLWPAQAGDTHDYASTHGTRTDIWTVWSGTDYRLGPLLKKFRGHVLQLGPDQPDRGSAHWALSDEYFHLVRLRTGVQLPSSGLLLLNMLTDSEPDQVDVYGFDFKRTASYSHSSIVTYPHEFDKEEIYCQEHVFSRPNFHLN